MIQRGSRSSGDGSDAYKFRSVVLVASKAVSEQERSRDIIIMLN